MLSIAPVVLAIALLLGGGGPSPAAADPSLVTMLRRLKDRTGWEANGIIDVGANQGVWSREARKLFPASKILMLEATPMHEPSLQTVTTELGAAEYQIAVITSSDGEVVRYFQGKNTGNSMFRERSNFYAYDKPVEHISKTVDTLVQQSFLKDEVVDVIKADVQGAELLVLQGAKSVLKQATFVYLEASTIEYNEGAPCFYEVDAYLRSQGYFLYDVANLNYNDAFRTFGLGQYDGTLLRCALLSELTIDLSQSRLLPFLSHVHPSR
jgi:FkbM family methyltransferase